MSLARRASTLLARSGGRAAWGLAALSGVLNVCAFPPIGLWPLAFVCLVPLYAALQGQSPLRAAGLGWLAGSITALVGLHWLPRVLSSFSTLSPGAGGALTCVFCLYLGLRQACVAAAFAGAVRRGHSPLFAFWAAVLVSELAFPTPVPWFLGTALHDQSLFLQVADLGGPLAVSALAVSANLVLAGLLPWKRSLAWALNVGVVFGGLTYGHFRARAVASEVERAPSLTIGIVQGNTPSDGSMGRFEIIDRYLSSSRTLLEAAPVDLLLWAENTAGREREPLAMPSFEAYFTRRLRVPLLFGAAVNVGETGFNSVFLSRADGSLCAECRYDKQRLFPIGEYIPGDAWVNALRRLSPRTGHFIAGPFDAPLALGDRRIAVTICYEDIHPELVRRTAENSDLLVNLGNDAWFSGTPAARWRSALARVRAVEHRRFLVRASNSGPSAVIDPTGRETLALPADRSTTGRARVAWMNGTTVYGRLGDAPFWCLAAVLAAMQLRRLATIRAWPSLKRGRPLQA